jgi:hypothetical protein
VEEMLVALICINGKGCNEAYISYAYHKPSVTEMITNMELKARDIAPTYVYEYILPMVAASSGVDISVKLNRNFSIKIKDTTSVTFKKEF